MRWKSVTILCLLCTSMVFIGACSDDESDNGNGGFEFIDQPLQGKIAGADWTFVIGSVIVSTFNSEEYRYSLLSTSIDNSELCDSFAHTGDRIFFFIPQEEGVFELSLDQSVAMFDEENTDNIIATDGAVEILSIDRDTGVITGRIDARFDGNNFVNGNFTATLCE